MKIKLLSVVPVAAVVVDDSTTLLSLATSESSTAANLLNAVGHRNVTAMEALVQELAQESLNAPTDGGYHSFSADITKALEAIKTTFVKSIQDALQDEHKADQEHFNCFTRDCFGKCITDYGDELKKCDNQDCTGAATAHQSCRKTVYKKYKIMADACAELHCFVPYNHKHTGKHVCAKDYCLCHDLTNCQYDGIYRERNRNRASKTDKDKLENEYYDLAWLEGDFSWRDDRTVRTFTKDDDYTNNVCEDSEINGPKECHAEKFGSWLSTEISVYKSEYKRWEGLWDKCSEAYKDFMKEDTSCDAKQQEFEKCLCAKNACEKNACNVDYDRCEAECWDRYKDLVDDKECLEKNRKIDWSATKKIECYLDVLLHDYTNKTLIEECKGENCINKIREEKYKKCAGICIEVDHEGVWPEATGSWPDQDWPTSFTLHDHRSAKADDPNGFHLGDTNIKLSKKLYECDDNGDIVFTKHRGGSALTREDEKRCTEHLDIDYQVPRCTPCRPEPEPVCDEVFHQKWYSQYDDTDFIESITKAECSNDNGEKGCFSGKELQSSSDGITFTTLVVKEHSHAWAYNRCNCQHCTDSAPVYPKRADGMQCGMGAHTLSPAKSPVAVQKSDLKIGGTGPASFNVNKMCVNRITLTHKSGQVSCMAQDLWSDTYKSNGMKLKMQGNLSSSLIYAYDVATDKMVKYSYEANIGTVADYITKTDSDSNWGCYGHSLGLVVSDDSNRIRAPVFDTTIGMTALYNKKSHWYVMDGVDHASKKMTWTFEEPLLFDGQYKLWFNEALSAGYTNFGEATYDLELEPSATQNCRPSPMQFTDVCTKAKGAGKHERANIKVPAGTCVSEIAVHWTSGYLSCRGHASGASRFGCGNKANNQKVGLVWTMGNTDTIALGSKKWVSVTNFDIHTDRTLAMKTQPDSTLIVTGDEGLDLWYTEDLRDVSEGDNHGVACYDVAVHQCA